MLLISFQSVHFARGILNSFWDALKKVSPVEFDVKLLTQKKLYKT